MRWFWSRRESLESEGEGEAQVAKVQKEASGLQELEHSQEVPGAPSLGNQDHDCQLSTDKPGDREERHAEEISRVDTQGHVQGIFQGLRQVLNNIKNAQLRPEEEREVIGMLFESVKEVHEAGRRNSGM